MNRRKYLAGLALGAAGLAGCQGAPQGGSPTSGDAETTTAGPTTSRPDTSTATPGTPPAGSGDPSGGGALRDVDLPLSLSDLARGAPEDAIPAITDPVFASDWSGLADRAAEFDVELRGAEGLALSDDDQVIGVERGGRARAYPLRILNWHEVVNDQFGGPLLVSYCPLCGSGVTAERRVAGEETVFGVSGYLWNSDLVMDDEATGSLWSQVLGMAVRGPQTGESLSLLPSSFTTWGTWKADHPETEVLLPPPISNTITGRTSRDYSISPYSGYDESRQVGIGYNEFADDRLHPKAQVVGVASDGEARAYPLERVSRAGVVNDTVGSLPVVVGADGAGSLYAYERTVGGSTLTFERAGPNALRAGGSRWRLSTGRALDGPHEGQRLTQANDRSPMFWFAWLDFFPETTVWGRGTETPDG